MPRINGCRRGRRLEFVRSDVKKGRTPTDERPGHYDLATWHDLSRRITRPPGPDLAIKSGLPHLGPGQKITIGFTDG